jgi:nanoRNase/pAp phosphatase (c-di-AMP/oligoRNAs hydrolase)
LGLFEHTDNVLVLISPDPDSMASSLAVKRLLWTNVQKTMIGYIGEIQRLENQAMMELLSIPMVRLNQVDLEYFNRHVLVDSQPHHYEALSRFEYDAVIDHHPVLKKWDVPYVDIRPEYGATATILIEYLRAANIKPSMKLATALLYAIKTDTANFERDATEADVRQFRYVFQYANMNLLRKIEGSELRLSDLQSFRVALEGMSVTRKGVYSHIGEVESPDICVQIAEFFMRIHGMGWSFVSGIYRGKVVVIIRSDGLRKDAGKLATRAFGHLGPAGGHRGAARAEIPLDVLREKGVNGRDTSIQRFVRSRLEI